MTFDRDWTIAPGETLREWCEENHLPHKAAATACGRMPVEMFEAIIAGKRRITKVIAEALAHGTGIPASLWLNLERNYRADLKAGRKDTTAR
jgi:plasmid maintenance system antidote protein VapI